MPTKGMQSKPTQWVQSCHLVTPYLTFQVQLVGLKPNKYHNQPVMSLVKGRTRAIVILTFFFLKNLAGCALDITLKWLQNHNCSRFTQ